MANQEKTGIILLNLGGPDTLEDVEPFLFNLFADREIIRLGPFFLQKFIARRIAKKRAPKSKESYAAIGGGSPLKEITRQQGEALARRLADQGNFVVDMAMRYWYPTARETLQKMADQGITRIVALPLYPHYSKATSGSSLRDLKRAASALEADFEIIEITSWPDDPFYIKSLASTITEGLSFFPSPEVEVVYSAHSLPVKFIDEGDPYLEELKKTIKAVENITGVTGRLCFQSRSGPVEWLRPSTPEMLADLAEQGCKQVLMVPISFVSDHVETLYEIDVQYKETAAELGIDLKRSESLNLRPDFIDSLASLVLEAVQK
ncbi:MAG: ferrochelatase [Desulfurivibrionaceae bacterium]